MGLIFGDFIMINWIKKILGIKEKPLVLDTPVMNTKDLNKMTKSELEDFGRSIGLELDKRKKKSTLVSEIKKAQK